MASSTPIRRFRQYSEEARGRDQMTRVFQDHEIRQYLLGDMSPAVEGELESAYFRDPELLARVEAARNDLFDDYAAQRLSDADRDKVEDRLLASDEGREELAITRALRNAAIAQGRSYRNKSGGSTNGG